MHTIKHICFVCHYAKKKSDDKNHLHEWILSQVSQILYYWQFVNMYKTIYYKVFEIVWSLSAWLKWNYFNAIMVMIMMMIISSLSLSACTTWWEEQI